MLLKDLLAIVDTLSSEDLELLKEHLAQREEIQQANVRLTPADLDAAIDAFWGDSSEEEMRLIFEAMTIKNRPF